MLPVDEHNRLFETKQISELNWHNQALIRHIIMISSTHKITEEFDGAWRIAHIVGVDLLTEVRLSRQPNHTMLQEMLQEGFSNLQTGSQVLVQHFRNSSRKPSPSFARSISLLRTKVTRSFFPAKRFVRVLESF